MKIIIDNREPHTFINNISRLLSDEKYSFVSIEVKPLCIGDIQILDNNNNIIIIMERKCISDLASSITDGRYNEQSFRLNDSNIHNHNIYYIIEGNISKFKSKYTRITTSSIYSSLFTLSYYKGFSVYRTENIDETTVFIINTVDKLYRETKIGQKIQFYKNTKIEQTEIEIETEPSTEPSTEPTTEPTTEPSEDIISKQSNEKQNADYNNYIASLKMQKKSYITVDNITSIMLMQIPNVSMVYATAITNVYKTIVDLICALQEDINCLNNISYTTDTGKIRKLNKTCIENIKMFILHEI